MKKSRLLVTLLLVIVLVLSVALVACDNTHKCESKCPDCGGCKNADCKEEVCAKKCTCSDVTETLAQTIVKGVFRMDAENRYELVKFYEDGTFYAYGLMTDVVRGRYVVHENYATAVNYIDCGDNGNWDDGEPTTPSTTNQVVELFQEDGTTPATNIGRKDQDIPQGSSLGNTVASNIIPYTDGWLHHVKVGAQTRSLRQNQNDTFSKDDEVAVLMYEFMIADDAANDSLIGGMWTQQRRKVSLYDKRFEESITDDAISEGTVTISGKVFTLKYEDNSTATVTISEDGKTATFQKGEKTIELVEWAEALPVAAELKTADGAPIPMVVTLYEDGSVKIASGSSKFSATYVQDSGTITITMAAGCPLTINSVTLSENDLTVVLVVPTGRPAPAPATMNVTVSGKVTGTLFTSSVATAKTEDGSLSIKLFGDGGAELTVQGQSGSSTVAVTYVVNSDNSISMTFADAKYSLVSATIEGNAITLNIDYAYSESYTMHKTLTGTITGKLLAVKLVKTVAKDVDASTGNAAFTVASNGMKFDLTVTFYNNGTVNISVRAVGLNVNGKYSTENRQLVITDIGNLTLAKDSGTNLVLGGTLSLGAGSSEVSATIACTPQELGALLA